MVNHRRRGLDDAFGALAHPIRRGIVAKLAGGEATVSILAKGYKVSAPAISKHLRILEQAGLMTRRKEGREHHCRLEVSRMQEVETWLEYQRRFWNDRLDSLEAYLKKNP